MKTGTGPAPPVSFQSTISEWPLKWTKPTVTYCLLKGTQDIPDIHEQAVGVNLAFQTWEDEMGLVLKKVLSTQNPDICIQWIDGKTDPVINGDNSILGYTSHFPDAFNNKIVISLNDSLNWSFSGTNFQWNPLNTLIHEIGHALGLVHSPDDPNSIMYPFYNGKLELDDLDISRIRTKYGSHVFVTPSIYQRIKNAIARWKLRLK